MQKICLKGILILAFFSFIALPTNCSFAIELDSIEGNSYLTFHFTDNRFNLDIFTFETDGIFTIETKDGTGTYEYHAPIFKAKWTSTDESTTYNFTGISWVSLVIMGWKNETISTSYWGDWERNYFMGIRSSLFPD